ncbi:uncharacterized protein DS421_19g662250 [Arachis hypogaea]|uniref:Aminotransferase-like plant mobile domain-containing protein n=1 Tax=Arachis hypogaea TaxID=3818 RepID=A0A6B9VAJ8_ARAHY|nr:uncharacterized protein DS421_19g662250 [Arachis hypogaea]
MSHTLPPPNAIILYLKEVGFGDAIPLNDFLFDNSLITAFVERWRPETHTFYLSWVSALSPSRMSHTTSSYVLIESQWVGTSVISAHCMRPRLWSWWSGYSVPGFLQSSGRVHRGMSQSLVASTTILLSEVSFSVLEICGASIDVPFSMFYSTLLNHRHHRVDRYDTAEQGPVRAESTAMTSGVGSVTDIYSVWLKEEAEWGTWMFVVPLVYFNIVDFYYVDRDGARMSGGLPSFVSGMIGGGVGLRRDTVYPFSLADCQLAEGRPTPSLIPWDVPDRRRWAKEVWPDIQRLTRRERGVREHGGAAAP